MRRIGLMVVTPLALTLVATPSPAVAGGWWSSIDVRGSQYRGVGEHMRAGTEFLFASLDEAEQARVQGSYYAYLISGFDLSVLDAAMRLSEPGDWWSLGDAEAILVGEVGLSGWDGNLARASVEFIVPRVDSGSYRLMFCDAGCTNPLGDIVPVGLSIFEDPLVAQLARRLDRLQTMSAERTRALRGVIRGLEEEILSVPETPDVADVVERVDALKRRLARPEGPAPVPWWAFAGWFAAGAALAGTLGMAAARKRARHTGPSGPLMFDADSVEQRLPAMAGGARGPNRP